VSSETVHKAMKSERLLFKHLLPTSVSYKMQYPLTLSICNEAEVIP